MKHFLKTLLPHFLKSFSGKFLLWHLAAIAVTYLCVVLGFDWWYFLHTRNATLNAISFPAIMLGVLVPIFLPLLLLLLGHIGKQKNLSITAWALWQAALLGWILSSTYKALTGRAQPNLHNTTIDISHQFHFGFLKHGIFWGWPSSHTTVAFAMAVTLAMLFPRQKKLQWVAIAFALYVGMSVSFNIHWLSEFLAGVIFGSLVGISVGKSYREKIVR